MIMILILSFLAASIQMMAPPSSPGTWVERESFVMGTALRVRVAAPARADGVAAIERVFEAVRGVDARLSTWREDSEIARVNRSAAGLAVGVSDTLYRWLREAHAWSAATAAAFDPGVGALIDLWDTRGAGRVPADAEVRARRHDVGIARFHFEDGARTIVRPGDGAWLDTGAFGKGIALREAAHALHAAGLTSAVLNFGGQVLAIGVDEGGHAWRVPVAHPVRRSEPAAMLRVSGRSVATSAQSEQANHILDPRTGRPVPAWGSVTVVADDAAIADAFATALFVMGPKAGMAWAESRSDIGVMFLVDGPGKVGGKVRRQWNSAMRQYLTTGSP